MIVGEHMSWCRGDHDVYGECVIERRLNDDLTVVLTGVPCDHVRIDLGTDALHTAGEVDLLVAVLTVLRPLLAASEADADCDLHEHPDEEDEEDEEEDDSPCDGCGAVDVNLLRIHIPAGETTQHLWWCRSCCEAGGVKWDVP